MTDNLFAWTWWALGQLAAEGASARPGGELLTGGSPRYQIYRTVDGRFVAAAPLEEKFWKNFCDVIGLDADRRDDRTDPSGVRTQVARLIASRTAEEWRARFAERDACCTVVADLHEALQDEHFRARGIFAAQVESQGARMPALPPPLAPQLRASETDTLSSPSLGEASAADILDDWATRDTTAHGAD
jgi:crotonobetainyl-CoA:carnitine CoA-transferase CaiB-like acyl-CoA transferase